MNAITPGPIYTKYLTEDPAENAKNLESSAKRARAYEVITIVALVAITAVVLALSIAGIIVTVGASLAVAGASISSLALVALAVHFRKEHDKLLKNAEIEKGVALVITTQNSNQTDARIQARLNYLTDTVKKLLTDAETALAKAKAMPLDSLPERQLSMHAYNNAWRIKEEEALPMLFEAAILHKIIANPALNIDITNYGHFIQKSWLERTAYAKQDKKFFVFSGSQLPRNKKGTSLSLKTIERATPQRLATMLGDLTPSGLRSGSPSNQNP